MTEATEVTQADRDFVADYLDKNGQMTERSAKAIRDGDWDKTRHLTDVALFRHRTQSAAQNVPVLLEALANLLPSKLMGESWNFPDDEPVTITVTFGKIAKARAAIAQAQEPTHER